MKIWILGKMLENRGMKTLEIEGDNLRFTKETEYDDTWWTDYIDCGKIRLQVRVKKEGK